jgi:hypothetical protein
MHLDVLARRADPAELVDEVHMPGGSAELAVGRGLQPGVALHRHRRPDCRILRGP